MVAAIKSGARAASGGTLVFMHGDGQHDPAAINALLVEMDKGYDMVVGARQERENQANMSAMLMPSGIMVFPGIMVFLIGPVSEQITNVMYKDL